MNTNLLYLIILPILWVGTMIALVVYAPRALPLLSQIAVPAWFVWGWKLSEIRS
jgi:hypothetical protein